MLKKKKWILISVVAVVVILVAGIVGGVVIHAQSPTPTATPSPVNPEKNFADRVASILGVDAAKVEAAFTQAQKDMQNEQLKTKLDAMVKAGKITQQQADQYQQWANSRPDIPALAGPMGPNGCPGFKNGFNGMPRFGKPPVTTPAPTNTPGGS